MKQVAVEKELSRNIVVFGLNEKDSEEVDKTVGEVLEHLGKKPSFEATRFREKEASTVHPVRVAMFSVQTVQRILGMSRKLHLSDKHYI